MFSNSLSFNSLDNTYGIMILSSQNKPNGLVDIVTPENPDARFQMFERTAQKNKATDFYNALQGNLQDSTLSLAFFSKENVQIIQNGVRAGVYEKSEKKFVIPPPNIDSLHIIMRSTFLQYSENSDINITGQIQKLNKIVIDYTVKELYSASVFHLNYLQDQSNLPVPLEQPLNHDRNYKQLEIKPFSNILPNTGSMTNR
jgi:hypothetical protein